MKTIHTTVYEFSELSKEAQEKAIEKHRGWNVSGEWYRSTSEHFKKTIQEIGFGQSHSTISIHFGLHSQGSGACFDSDSLDTAKLAKRFAKLKKWESGRFVALVENYSEIMIGTTPLSNRYSHERTRVVNGVFHFDRSGFGTVSHYEGMLTAFVEWLETERIELCREMYKAFDAEYDHLTSDKQVAVALEMNAVEFHKNGNDFQYFG